MDFLNQLILLINAYGMYYLIGIPVSAALYGFFFSNVTVLQLITWSVLWPILVPYYIASYLRSMF